MDSNNNSQQLQTVSKRQINEEAILKAIYLITDLFDDNEPLKNKMRLAVVDAIYAKSKIKSNCYSILMSYIQIANNISIISNMNTELLLKAVNGVIKSIDLNNKDIVLDLDIADTSDDVNIPNTAAESIQNKDKIDQNKEEKKDERQVKVELKETETTTKERNMSFTLPQKSANIIEDGFDIGSRRKRIIEIVKTHGQITINQIMDNIKGCSSKTIQRELTSLVLSGTLKKTGERRWSQYSLK